MNIKGTKQNSQNRLWQHTPEGGEHISRIHKLNTFVLYIHHIRVINIFKCFFGKVHSDCLNIMDKVSKDESQVRNATFIYIALGRRM
jgi:hypothetical protein